MVQHQHRSMHEHWSFRTLVLVGLVLFLNSCLTFATPHITGWPHEHTHINDEEEGRRLVSDLSSSVHTIGDNQPIADKTDDVRSILSPDGSPEDHDVGNKLMYIEETRPVPVYISKNSAAGPIAQRFQVNPLAEEAQIDKKLPHDPSYGWAGKFEYPPTMQRGDFAGFDDDIFQNSGFEEGPESQGNPHQQHPQQYSKSGNADQSLVYQGTGGRLGGLGGVGTQQPEDDGFLQSFQSLDLEEEQQQGAAGQRIQHRPQGYEETDYLEPHDQPQYVQVGYQGAKEMEGGHAFHVPGIGHDARGGARAFQVPGGYPPQLNNFQQQQLGYLAKPGYQQQQYLQQQQSNGLQPGFSGGPADNYRKPAVASYQGGLPFDPDGFGSINTLNLGSNDNKNSVHSSPFPPSKPELNYEVYERLVEEQQKRATDGDIFNYDSSSTLGVEDVHGIEAAAEAAIEEQINNDPRYNDFGYDPAAGNDINPFSSGQSYGQNQESNGYGQDPYGPDSDSNGYGQNQAPSSGSNGINSFSSGQSYGQNQESNGHGQDPYGKDSGSNGYGQDPYGPNSDGYGQNQDSNSYGNDPQAYGQQDAYEQDNRPDSYNLDQYGQDNGPQSYSEDSYSQDKNQQSYEQVNDPYGPDSSLQNDYNQGGDSYSQDSGPQSYGEGNSDPYGPDNGQNYGQDEYDNDQPQSYSQGGGYGQGDTSYDDQGPQTYGQDPYGPDASYGSGGEGDGYRQGQDGYGSEDGPKSYGEYPHGSDGGQNYGQDGYDNGHPQSYSQDGGYGQKDGYDGENGGRPGYDEGPSSYSQGGSHGYNDFSNQGQGGSYDGGKGEFAGYADDRGFEDAGSTGGYQEGREQTSGSGSDGPVKDEYTVDFGPDKPTPSVFGLGPIGGGGSQGGHGEGGPQQPLQYDYQMDYDKYSTLHYDYDYEGSEGQAREGRVEGGGGGQDGFGDIFGGGNKDARPQRSFGF